MSSTGSASGSAVVSGVGSTVTYDPNKPSLTLPYGFPPFLRDGHDADITPAFADAKVQTGPARRQRTYQTTMTTLGVSLELQLDQTASFDAWYEGPLKAAEAFFSAEVANEGPGLLWWKARWVGPYTSEYLGGLWWKISGKLLLFGEGSTSPPEVSQLSGGVLFDLLTSGEVTAGQPLSGGVTFDLTAGIVVSLAGGVTFNLTLGTYTPPIPRGMASGSSTVTGIGTSSLGVGMAAGTSSVQGRVPDVGTSGVIPIGRADGSSTVLGRGIAPSVGSASGSGTATAFMLTAVLGDRRIQSILLRGQTTNATPTALTTDAGAASAANQLLFPSGPATYKIAGHVSAMNSTTGDVSGWEISAVLKRSSGGTVSVVGTPNISTPMQDTGASAWVVAVAADNTNKCVQVLVTGVASTTIDWSCHIYSVEPL